MVYIDGFNLYFGLRERNWRCFYWLDVNKLAMNLLESDQCLVAVHYFTARLSAYSDKQRQSKKRQTVYLEAIETLPDTNIHFGHFLAKRQECRSCNSTWRTFEEKKTDVNIAVELLSDAYKNKFDTAILVSGDSDLTPPIDAVLRNFPSKRVVVAFPPRRNSKELKKRASGWIHIDRKTLQNSQFPQNVETENGFVLQRPKRWN